MEHSGPRSTVVDLRWRPCLAFYEHGVEVLRFLDNAGLLRQFKVEKDHVNARLTTGTDLRVGVLGVTFTAPAGSLPVDAVRLIVNHIAQELQPADLEAKIILAYLEPLRWDLTYEHACMAATAAWLPGVASAAAAYDSATLIDGRSQRYDIRFQAEFGIVDADQIPARLARALGNRIGGPVMSMADQAGLDVPPLAVFVDSSWFPQDAPGDADDLTDWVSRVLGEATEEAAHLTSSLHQVCENGRTTRNDEGMEVS
jgi:hypothetical protein